MVACICALLGKDREACSGIPITHKMQSVVLISGNSLCVFDASRAGEQEAILIKKHILLFQQCVFLILPGLCWLHLLWDSLQRKQSLQSACGVPFQIAGMERQLTVDGQDSSCGSSVSFISCLLFLH